MEVDVLGVLIGHEVVLTGLVPYLVECTGSKVWSLHVLKVEVHACALPLVTGLAGGVNAGSQGLLGDENLANQFPAIVDFQFS